MNSFKWLKVNVLAIEYFLIVKVMAPSIKAQGSAQNCHPWFWKIKLSEQSVLVKKSFLNKIVRINNWACTNTNGILMLQTIRTTEYRKYFGNALSTSLPIKYYEHEKCWYHLLWYFFCFLFTCHFFSGKSPLNPTSLTYKFRKLGRRCMRDKIKSIAW